MNVGSLAASGALSSGRSWMSVHVGLQGVDGRCGLLQRRRVDALEELELQRGEVPRVDNQRFGDPFVAFGAVFGLERQLRQLSQGRGRLGEALEVSLEQLRGICRLLEAPGASGLQQ